MDSLSANESNNFFEHNFSTHIKESLGWFIAFAGLKFAQANRFILQVGTKDFAKFESDGTESFSPNYPFKLTFVPKISTPSEYPSYWDSGNAQDFTDILVSSLDSSDVHLFEIYAYE